MNTPKAAKLANRRKLQGSMVCAIMASQGINVVGYWVPNEDPAWNDTFIYRVAHPGRDRAIFPQ